MTVCPENVAELKRAYGAGEVVGSFMPAVFVVEPTSHCALNCVMCPQSELGANQLGQMSLQRASAIAKAIAPFAELTMLYFMGEPLQHSDIDAYLSLMRNALSGRLVLSTNGMDLNEENRASLLRNVDVVIACVDRWDSQAYRRIRRGGNFETVVANFEALLAERGDSLSPMVIAKTLDIHMPPDEQTRFAAHWSERGAIPLIGWVDTWAGQLPSLRKLTSTPAPYDESPRVACADLWFKMVINWRSEVVLCCHNFNYSHKLGSVRSAVDIARVWHSQELGELRRDHLRGNFACNSLCEGCREWGALTELDAYVDLSPELLHLVF